jgi:hypothetical protein
VYSYTAYGLGIRSELPLPELDAPHGAGSDIEIRFGRLDRIRLQAAGRRHHARLTPHEAELFWEEVGAFQVRDGREIIIDPTYASDHDGIRLLLLGSVFGVLLHQRQTLLLHASAVAIDGRVVAFMGHSGWGKSTMAAAFHAAGHEVLTDDITAIAIEGSQVCVIPGFPQIKLHPDSAEATGHAVTSLPRLHGKVEKRALRFIDRFSRQPLPLSCIYVLAEGLQPEIEEVRRQDALVELVRHSYAAGILKSTGAASANMLQCADVARTVPLRRLRKGHSLEMLPELVRIVTQDIITIATFERQPTGT